LALSPFDFLIQNLHPTASTLDRLEKLPLQTTQEWEEVIRLAKLWNASYECAVNIQKKKWAAALPEKIKIQFNHVIRESKLWNTICLDEIRRISKELSSKKLKGIFYNGPEFAYSYRPESLPFKMDHIHLIVQKEFWKEALSVLGGIGFRNYEEKNPLLCDQIKLKHQKAGPILFLSSNLKMITIKDEKKIWNTVKRASFTNDFTDTIYELHELDLLNYLFSNYSFSQGLNSLSAVNNFYFVILRVLSHHNNENFVREFNGIKNNYELWAALHFLKNTWGLQSISEELLQKLKSRIGFFKARKITNRRRVEQFLRASSTKQEQLSSVREVIKKKTSQTLSRSFSARKDTVKN